MPRLAPWMPLFAMVLALVAGLTLVRPSVEPSAANKGQPVLTLILRDLNDGTPTAARIRIVGPSGVLFDAPDSILRTHHAPVMGPFVYAEDNLSLVLPPGDYTVHAVRGVTGTPLKVPVSVTQNIQVQLDLEDWADPFSEGWVGADPHTHIEHTIPLGSPPPYPIPSNEEMALMGRAEGLDVLYLLNNAGEAPSGAVSKSMTDITLAWGEEFRSGFWGHLVMLGLEELVTVNGATSASGPQLTAWPTLDKVLTDAPGALAIMAHPHTTDDPYPAFGWPYTGYARELAALALGPKLFGLAVGSRSNGPESWQSEQLYDGLAVGARWAVTGETDAILTHFYTSTVGLPRTYAYLQNPSPPGSVELEAEWRAGVTAGRSFATSGPLIQEFDVEGTILGDTHSLTAGGSAQVHLKAHSYSPLLRAAIRGSRGELWSQQWNPAPAVNQIDLVIPIQFDEDDFIILELEAQGGDWWNNEPITHAISSPIYIDVGIPAEPEPEIARRGADELRLFWERSLEVRGYPSAVESLATYTYLTNAADAYEAMVDDPPPPFELIWPEDGRTFYTEGGMFQWEAPASYDGETISYTVELATNSGFVGSSIFGPTNSNTVLVDGLVPSTTYYWRVWAEEPGEPPVASNSTWDFATDSVVVAASPLGATAPLELGLPRVTGSSVRVAYRLQGQQGVRFRWYDVRGRLVRDLPSPGIGAGWHELVWDRRDSRGRPVAAGVYWLVGEAEGARQTRSAALSGR